MIQKDTAGNATVVGMTAQSGFSILASAKAFKILSSGIYKNKILAPIRELSTNAIDIHRKFNVDRPFEVQLPNNLNPHFVVRDFGPGLSKLQIMGDKELDIQGIYTTYFLSTKETEADQIGCLGLGTKSPFAYVTSFTVTSYFDGLKSVYAMYLDGDMPNVNLVGSEPSDEPTGLEVSFGVNVYDFSTFKNELQKLYSFWTEAERPVVTGQTVSYTNYMEGKTKGNGWFLSDQTYGNLFNRGYFHVVMGNIAYKVNCYDGPNKAFEEIAEYSNLIFECDLGEVNFTASREELELDNNTVAAIVQRIEDFKQSIVVSLEEQVNNAGSLWKARHLVADFKKSHSLVKRHDFKYHGMTLIWNERVKFTKTPMVFYVRKHDQKLHKKQDITSFYIGDASRNTTFYFNDLEKPQHTHSRMNFHLRTHKTSNEVVLIDGVSFRDAKRIFGLSKDQITRVSTLDIPVRTPRMRRDKNLDFDDQIEFCNKHIMKLDYYRWNDCILPKSEPVYYFVDLKGQKPQSEDEEITSFDNVVRFMRECTSYDVTTVYGVRGPAKKLVEESDAWVNIYDLFKVELKKYLDKYPLAEYASKDYLKTNVIRELLKIKEVLALNPVTENGDICKKISKIEADVIVPSTWEWKMDYYTFQRLAYKIGVSLPESDNKDITTLSQDVKDIRVEYATQFPLMQHLSYSVEGKKEYLRLWVVDQEAKALANTVQESKLEDTVQVSLTV